MTKKADFNAEEWSTVLQGPPIAGMLVLTSERGGTLRESVSMGQAYAETRKQHGASELLDEIVSSQPEFDRTRFQSVEELGERGPDQLREAMRLLSEKATPDEVADYKRFVVLLAERVAQAHKEGGFLGIGGRRVTEREQAALDRILVTLDAEQP